MHRILLAALLVLAVPAVALAHRNAPPQSYTLVLNQPNPVSGEAVSFSGTYPAKAADSYFGVQVELNCYQGEYGSTHQVLHAFPGLNRFITLSSPSWDPALPAQCGAASFWQDQHFVRHEIASLNFSVSP